MPWVGKAGCLARRSSSMKSGRRFQTRPVPQKDLPETFASCVPPPSCRLHFGRLPSTGAPVQRLTASGCILLQGQDNCVPRGNAAVSGIAIMVLGPPSGDGPVRLGKKCCLINISKNIGLPSKQLLSWAQIGRIFCCYSKRPPCTSLPGGFCSQDFPAAAGVAVGSALHQEPGLNFPIADRLVLMLARIHDSKSKFRITQFNSVTAHTDVCRPARE